MGGALWSQVTYEPTLTTGEYLKLDVCENTRGPIDCLWACDRLSKVHFFLGDGSPRNCIFVGGGGQM